MRQHTTWSTLSAARRNWSAVTSALFFPTFACLMDSLPMTQACTVHVDMWMWMDWPLLRRSVLWDWQQTILQTILAFMKVITTNVNLVIHYVASKVVLPVSPTSLLSKKPSNDPEPHCAIHDHWCLHTLAGHMHTLACCFCSRPTSTSDSCCVFVSEPVD